MRLHRKYVLCTMVACKVVFILFYCYHAGYGLQKKRVRELLLATDTITALDNQTFIISPYFDPRLEPSVRVIAIIHVSVEELYCIFHCSTKQNIFIRAQIDLHSDRFEFPYRTADLLCSEPSECDYRYMSFSTENSTNIRQNRWFKVKDHTPQPISANFTVCISTLFGNYNNVLQMVQHIEMYKIMGASKVTIYNTSVSPDVEKVLHHYIAEGTIDVVPWPIDRHLKTTKEWHHSQAPNAQLGYYGQTAALNDCLYRNMYKSKFLLLNDIDEIILPIKDRDWPSMMENLQKKFPGTSVFCFENHVFPTSFNISGFNLWPHVPGVNILHHSVREPINRAAFNDRKMIVNPREVFQTSIHSALKQRGEWKNIAQHVAITFHCTHGRRHDISEKDLIPDDILRRHNMSLVPNVDKVIQRLFPQL